MAEELVQNQTVQNNDDEEWEYEDVNIPAETSQAKNDNDDEEWEYEDVNIPNYTTLDADTGEVYSVPATMDETDTRFAIATQHENVGKENFIGKIQLPNFTTPKWAELRQKNIEKSGDVKEVAKDVKGFFSTTKQAPGAAAAGAYDIGTSTWQGQLDKWVDYYALSEYAETGKNVNYKAPTGSVPGAVAMPGEVKEAQQSAVGAISVANAMEDAAWSGRYTSEEIEAAKAEAKELSNKAVKLIDEWRSMNQERWEKTSNELYPMEMRGQKDIASLFYGIGNGGASIAATIAMTVATKNPTIAAMLMGKMFFDTEKSSAFQEAKAMGEDFYAADWHSDVLGVVEGGLEGMGDWVLMGLGKFATTSGFSKVMKRGAVTAVEKVLAKPNVSAPVKNAIKVVARKSPVLSTGLKGFLTEGPFEETLQNLTEDEYKNYLGWQDKDQGDILGDALWAGFVGGITGFAAGAGGSALYNRKMSKWNNELKTVIKKENPNLSEEDAQKAADLLQESYLQEGAPVIEELNNMLAKEKDVDALPDEGLNIKSIGEVTRNMMKERFGVTDEEIDNWVNVMLPMIDARNQYNEAYQGFYDQLTDAGRDEKLADREARIIAARATTLAIVRKQSVGDILNRWKLRIEGDQTKINMPGEDSAEIDAVDVEPSTQEELNLLQQDINRLKRGVSAKKKAKGTRLAQFIVQNGGISDDRGDIKAMGSIPGLLNKKGISLDEAARMAWDAGYITGAERPDVNQLLDLLSDDLGNKPVYTENDQLKGDSNDYYRSLEDAIDRAGVDIDNDSIEEIDRKLKVYRKRLAAWEQLGRGEEQNIVPDEDLPFWQSARKSIEETMFKPSAQDEKTYIDDLRTVEKGEETRIRVGALPQVYQSLGIPAGLVRTNKDVIIKDSITKHSVPLDVVENLPKLYADPIMVMDSRTVDGRIVALVDAKDKEGQQILVVISPNKRQKGGYHFIPSFYGKEELSDFVAKNIEEGNLKYIKSSQALDSLQLRPQVKTLLSSSITNVLQKDAIVKQNATESYYQVAAENEKFDTENPAYEGETININGQEKTVYNSNGDRIAKSKEALENFYKWFGDSKVVDEQGRPLVVYHGTNKKFDTFDKGKIGKKHKDLYQGKGFYFTSEYYDAQNYGRRIMPVYLKIENPALSDYNLKPENDGISAAHGVWVAFNPNQVKSTSNRGTYSESENIYYQQSEQSQSKEYNPRDDMPKVRGGWTKNKILNYMKKGSLRGIGTATRMIAEFDSVEDLKNNMFYHGAKYGTSERMKPSITMSDKEVERIGGGGYGDKYWAISLSKSKRVAGTFATASGNGRIYPVLLVKNANVIEMPELEDSADLEEHIEQLYNDGVDAVWIGDKDSGEQELAVINPKAIVNLGTPEFYRAYKLGSPENPINIRSDEEIQQMFDYAKDFVAQYPKTAPDEAIADARKMVFWQSAFHGSPNKELEGGKFDLKYAGKTTGNVHGHGVYAVVSKPSAEYWAGENGQVYELDVPEDFELIDEQKGFDEQSEKVRYAILGALEKINGFGLLEKAVLDNMPGGEIYVALGKDVFFDKHGYEGGSTEIMKAASEFLDKLGIKGITYDYANEKNFVIFNPDNVKVLQKFYQVSADGTLVIDSQKEMAGLSDEEFKDKMLDILKGLKGRKIYNTSLGGDIEIRTSSIKKYKSFFADRNKRLIVPYVPELLQKAQFTKEDSYTPETEKNIVAYWKTDLPISIDNDSFYAHLTVKQDDKGNFFWDAQVKEKARRTVSATNPSVGELTSDISEDTLSITQRTDVVNRYRQDTARPQGARGSFTRRADTGEAIIELFETADASTIIHELGHFFLDDMKRFADDPTTAEQLQAIYKYVGSLDGNLSREQHEYFARSFEAYLREGRSPNSTLKRVFARFRFWLKKIYDEVKLLDVDLDDNIRQVFDEMLGGKQLDYILQRGSQDLQTKLQRGFISAWNINKAMQLLHDGKMSKADMQELINELKAGKMEGKDFGEALKKFERNNNIHKERLTEWDYNYFRTQLDNLNFKRDKVKEKILRLLDWTKPRSRGGKLVGRFPNKYLNDKFDHFRELANMDKDEARAKQQENLKLLEEYTFKGGNINAEQLRFENKLLSLATGRISDDSLLELYEALSDSYNEGRLTDKITGEIKKARKERMINEAKEVLTDAGRINWHIEDRGLKAWAQKQLRNFGRSQMSWSGLLDMLSINDRSSKTGQSLLSQNLDMFEAEQTMYAGVAQDGENISTRLEKALSGSANKAISVNRYINKELDKEVTIEWTGNENLNNPGLKPKPFMIRKTFTKDKLIDIYMKSKDEDTLEIMNYDEIHQYNDEFLAKVEAELTEDDIAVANALFDFYNDNYDRFNKFYEDHFGISLAHNKYYSPRSVTTTGIDVKDGSPRAYASFSGAKQRTAGKGSTINIKGAFAALNQYVQDLNHYIGYADKLQDINAVMGNKDIKEIIDNVFGGSMNARIKYEIENMANSGADKQNVWDRLTWLRSNYAKSVLSVKPSLAIKQLTSFPAYWENMSAVDFVSGVADFFKHPKEAMKILGNTTLMKTRGTNIIRDFEVMSKTEAFKNMKKSAGKIKWNDLLMANIKFGDRGAIYIGGWALYRAELKKNLANGMSEADAKAAALNRFERVTDETQQSGRLSQQSYMQSHSGLRAFTMFTSSQNQYLRKELNAIRGLVSGRMDKKQVAKTIFIYHFLLPMFFQAVSDGFRWDKDAQLRTAALGSLNGWFILNKMLENIYNLATGQGSWHKTDMTVREFVPFFGTAEDTKKLVMKFFNDDDIEAKDVIKVIKVVGEASGLPFKYGMDVALNAGDYASEGEYGKEGLLWLGWSPYSLRDFNE